MKKVTLDSCMECLTCHSQIGDLKFKGAVLIAEGVVSIDASGKIAAIGPARAIQTIKAGEEASSIDIVYTCPKCGFSGGMDNFKIVRLCSLTGKEATKLFVTPWGSTVWIADDAEEFAAQVFTLDAVEWETSIDV